MRDSIGTLALVVTFGVAAVAAVAADKGGEMTAPCSIGGFSIGDPEPAGVGHYDLFIQGKPQSYRPSGVRLYRVVSDERRFAEFIAVAGERKHGTIVAVIREFDGSESAKVYAAMLEKYGQPVTLEDGSDPNGGYSPWGGVMRNTNRQLWKDKDCGLDVEFVKTVRTVATGYGGGANTTADVVWTRPLAVKDGKGVLD